MEVWSCAGTTAAVQAPPGGCYEASVVRRPGTKVIGKMKCVRCSMCRLMMIIQRNRAQLRLNTVCGGHPHSGVGSLSQTPETPVALDMVTVPLAC